MSLLGTVFGCAVMFAVGFYIPLCIHKLVTMRRAPREGRVDLAKIHRLEYELGFRDDAPPKPKVHHGPQTARHAAMMKDWWTSPQVIMPSPTDKPGAVVYYDPKQGTPYYDDPHTGQGA